MKIAVYETRKDEMPVLEWAEEHYGIRLETTGSALTEETVGMAMGCDGVTFWGEAGWMRICWTVCILWE